MRAQIREDLWIAVLASLQVRPNSIQWDWGLVGFAFGHDWPFCGHAMRPCYEVMI